MTHPPTMQTGRVCRLHRPARTTAALRMAGLTYVEVLIAMVLIAVTLIPAMDALRPAVAGAGINETRTTRHYHLTAMLEEILASPFDELDTEAVAISNPAVASTLYSDLPASNDRRLVYLSRYDADNADGNGNPFDAGMDEGLLWVRIEIEATDQAIEGLTSQYE